MRDYFGSICARQQRYLIFSDASEIIARLKSTKGIRGKMKTREAQNIYIYVCCLKGWEKLANQLKAGDSFEIYAGKINKSDVSLSLSPRERFRSHSISFVLRREMRLYGKRKVAVYTTRVDNKLTEIMKP